MARNADPNIIGAGEEEEKKYTFSVENEKATKSRKPLGSRGLSLVHVWCGFESAV